MARSRDTLTEANRQVADFQQRTLRQERVIADLRRDGHPTENAERLLEDFRECLRFATRRRDLILAKTAKH